MAAATCVGFFISWLFYITNAAGFPLSTGKLSPATEGPRWRRIFPLPVPGARKSSGSVADNPAAIRIELSRSNMAD